MWIELRPADVLDLQRVVAGSVFVAVALTLAGCGGESEASASANCLTVPPEVMTAIGDGAPEGSGFVGQEGAAVLGAANEINFVAMRFEASGQKDMVGVWSTTSIAPNEAATVISVDGFAKQFTVWPDAEQAFDISPAHPSVTEAEDCLG